MYAVIETGGKQYLVEEGATLEVEKLNGEAGEEVSFDKVLLIGGDGKPSIGTPNVEGAVVTGSIVKQGRGKKLYIYHKKRRKGFEKKTGHRQAFTEVKVNKITGK